IEIKFSKTSDEFDQKELLQMEKDFLGIYISGHPLDKFRDKIATFDYISSSNFGEISGAMETILIGKIEDFSTRITKTGKKMGILNVLDLDGTFELVVFDSLAERISNFSDSEKEKPYVFRVRISADDGLKISLLDISDLQYANSEDFAKKVYKKRNGGANNFANNFNQTPARKIEELKITLNANELNEEKIDKIFQIAHHQSKNQSNYKKLILIINLDDSCRKIPTMFFIDDNFSQEVEKIIKIA
ncbi:MAG: DNA polymerase III subunit alpha, partial [Campylobacter sp.]